MSVIYRETTTIKVYKEIEKITKQPENPEHKHLKGKKLKSVAKMFDGNTDKFEPIPENRDKLIKTLLPLVLKLAKARATTFNALRIEFDDCISAGMQGAVIATDKYIENSKIQKQPAKLSTYAYSYIIKYINEYIYANTSSLSYGVTKGREANACKVLSGNKTNESAENGSGEYFDTSSEKQLMSYLEIDENRLLRKKLTKSLFSCITLEEKTAIFMFFGINLSKQYTIEEIAKQLKTKQYAVEQLIQNSFTKIREKFQYVKDKSELIELLTSNIDADDSIDWFITLQM